MVWFIEGHGHIRFVASRQWPGGRENGLVTVHHSNGILAGDIYEHARAGLFERNGFDVIVGNLYVADFLFILFVNEGDKRIGSLSFATTIYIVHVRTGWIVVDGVSVDGNFHFALWFEGITIVN